VEKLRRKNRIQERILSNEVPTDWIWTRPNFLMTCPQRKEGLLTEQLLKLCWKQNILQMAMPSLAACCTAPRQRRYRGISCLIISTAKKGAKESSDAIVSVLIPVATSWQLSKRRLVRALSDIKKCACYTIIKSAWTIRQIMRLRRPRDCDGHCSLPCVKRDMPSHAKLRYAVNGPATPKCQK